MKNFFLNILKLKKFINKIKQIIFIKNFKNKSIEKRFT